MTTSPDSWSIRALAALVRHLGEAVRALLPTGLELITFDLEIALVRRGPDGAARTVRSMRANPPTDPMEAPSARAASELLGELQRLIGHHLGRPWPTNTDGVVLHADADQIGDEIRPRFVARGTRAGSPPLLLPPFPLPRPPRGG